MIEKVLIYFIDPKKEGYSFLKTLIYSLIFCIIIFLIYKIIKKHKIRIDRNFVLFSYFLSLPFSALRVLEDYKVINGILFVTPWIEFLYFSLFIFLIFPLRKILKEDYEKPIFIFGIIISFIFIFQLDIKNFFAITVFTPILLLFLFIFIFLKINLFNKLLILSQIYEATITTVNVNIFKFYEQHFLSRFLLEISPILFLIIKFLFAILLIKALDVFSKNEELKNFIKTAFSVLSFSIGNRNLLQALAY